ncbi:alpha/beta hydrolase [Nocardia sp. NPDC051321]|uniref:alpha/beta hydrolase n=1 Tax=Nocardia sp. NPDC051321 TaxID=3364323 RepID=UPI003792F4EE
MRTRSADAELAALHPDARRLVRISWRARSAPFHQLSVEEGRAELARLLAGNPGSPAVTSVVERRLSFQDRDCPIRVYRHDDAVTDRDRTPPVVLYLHGGGWALGDLDTADRPCRELAIHSKMVVVSLGYRRAPEHPFPQAYDDVEACVDWLTRRAGELGGDPHRIAVVGDSAGGNLAAAVARARRTVLAAQVLIYPQMTSVRRTDLLDRRYDDFCLSIADGHYFEALYLGDRRADADPRFDLLGAEPLADLPQALLIRAECDPLHRHALAYGALLRRSGVPVQILAFDGMVHGFFGLSHLLPAATEAIRAVSRFLINCCGPLSK